MVSLPWASQLLASSLKKPTMKQTCCDSGVAMVQAQRFARQFGGTLVRVRTMTPMQMTISMTMVLKMKEA